MRKMAPQKASLLSSNGNAMLQTSEAAAAGLPTNPHQLSIQMCACLCNVCPPVSFHVWPACLELFPSQLECMPGTDKHQFDSSRLDGVATVLTYPVDARK